MGTLDSGDADHVHANALNASRRTIDLSNEELSRRSRKEASKLVRRFETKLSSGGIVEAIRYETQAAGPCQMAQALINIATRSHPGMPLSNSYLLHELAEAKAWRAIGLDFSSKRLLRLTFVQRSELKEQKRFHYHRNISPHLEGIAEQNKYLQAVALAHGYTLSLGAVFKHHPVMPSTEVDKICSVTSIYQTTESETPDAVHFYRSLLASEPGWREFPQGYWVEKGRTSYFFVAESRLMGKAPGTNPPSIASDC